MSHGSDFDSVTQILAADGERLRMRARKIRVEIVGGPSAGQTVELAGPEVRIGSARGSELLLLDAAVSRHHVTLRIDATGIRVIDAGSRNGTVLDGVRIRDAYARADSAILLGNTTLRLRLLHDVIELPLSARERFGGLIGKSVAMRQVFTLLERVTDVDDTILIEGETGTGKELAAEAVHEASPRAGAPFVVFDCSAVAPNLVESELFGHVRGAFSGAVADREGAIEAADGGTLFLDEVGELPRDLQPKLLRALERFEVRRLGSNTHKRIDVRVVAATNKNLSEEVAAGRFREDLYYRLAVVRVFMPPLRERPEDIAPLVEHFNRELSRRGPPGPLPDRVMRGFLGKAWPGNVRELRNAVARALSFGTGPVEAAPAVPEAAPSVSVDLTVPLKSARDRVAEAFELAYVREALKETGGNVSQAARLAGVNRKFIQRAIVRYGLRGDSDD